MTDRSRDLAPDVLRGFALLGILIVNIPFFAISSFDGARGDSLNGTTNLVSAFLMISLCAGKFYLLFSFLFGYSTSYIVRGEKQNRLRWVKRCALLMLVGVVHFSLLWHGDILFMYGAFGFLLIPFLFSTDRTINISMVIIYGISALLLLTVGSVAIASEIYFRDAVQPLPEFALDGILRQGSFIEAIVPRLELWLWGIIGVGLLLQGGLAFVAFLAGIRASRKSLLSSDLGFQTAPRMIRWGLGFGIPIQLLVALIAVRNEISSEPSEAIYISSIFIAYLTAPLLAMAYMGIVLKLLQRKPGLVNWMRHPGKMSLTVYISQSVLLSMVFGPWGLGLFQRLDLWVVMIIAIATWLLLTAFAAVWFRRFHQGPMERFLSALTR